MTQIEKNDVSHDFILVILIISFCKAAKLLEKLHEKNENLIMENKKLEEMVKQLLLNREITRIRKLYPTVIENLPIHSNENSTRNHNFSNKTIQEVYEENQSNYNENSISEEKSLNPEEEK